MKEHKVHYRPSRHKDYMQCGGMWKNNTRSTWNLDSVTCRVCMFSYLAEQAPWAREFMDKLRGALVAAKRSAGAAQSVAVPATLAEQVDGKEERLGRSLGTLLSQEGTSEKLIREFLPIAAPAGGSVEPVMDNSRAAAEPVGVQPRKVAEYARDAGKIGDKSGWDF